MTIIKHIDFQAPDFGEFPAGPQVLPGYRATILNDNPIAYWRLGESSGVAAGDETNQHDGIYAPDFVGAWTGGALDQPGALTLDSDAAPAFDGTTGHVQISHHADFDRASAGTIALEVWIRISSGASLSAFNYIVTKRSGGAGNFSYWLAAASVTGQNRFLLNGAGPSTTMLASSQTIETERWYHVVGTIDDTTGKLFIDGALDATGSVDAVADTTLPIVIGARSDGGGGALFHFDGRIDECAIYPALTDAQIANHYQIGIGQ